MIDESEVQVLIHYEDGENVKNTDSNKQNCANDCALKILNHCYHDDYELYIITLAEELQPTWKYLVKIPYRGELTQALSGYYRSSYKDLKTGETRYLFFLSRFPELVRFL